MVTSARWLPDVFGLPLTQHDVDFVIPRLDSDIPLCIDPFLLFKSKRQDLRAAHDLLLGIFFSAFDAIRNGNDERARRLLDFPEVREIRFGYTEVGIEGRGIGQVYGGAVFEAIRASPFLVERGLRHVEELQLFSLGIAEDRVSDLTANVLKSFLVNYTAAQSRLWSIPLTEGVPLPHVWDHEMEAWTDQYVTIPVDPESGVGILLVPRWIVRQLPWINFDDFLRTDLNAFLKSRLPGQAVDVRRSKERAVEITKRNLEVVDAYVDRKERESGSAQPDPPPLLALQKDITGEELLERLKATPIGRKGFSDHQRLVLQLLNRLFEPELVDGEEQVRTASGVEIRDLIFSNNSDLPFLRFLMTSHNNLLVTFECKNVQTLEVADINQLANYLGDPLGYCGFIVARNPPSKNILAKARATYSKQHPRKVILMLCDEDLSIMVAMKKLGQRHPVEHLQRKYRSFVQSID